jgi:hypothetical protein
MLLKGLTKKLKDIKELVQVHKSPAPQKPTRENNENSEVLRNLSYQCDILAIRLEIQELERRVNAKLLENNKTNMTLLSGKAKTKNKNKSELTFDVI